MVKDKIVSAYFQYSWKVYRKSRYEKKENILYFLGSNIPVFCYFTRLAIFFFSYLGQGQGGFIYNEFNSRRKSIVSNKPIVDMIETIEHFARTQASYPVYNVLGRAYLWRFEGWFG